MDPSLAGQPGTKSFEYRAPCRDPKGKDESDLCAQWKAANAAEDSALWAKWGFWIGVVGSGFLLWQIILTRQAVEDTGDATAAMQSANEIAKAAQRPWLHIDNVEAKMYALESSSGELIVTVYAWVTVKNVGGRPAFQINRREMFGPTGSMRSATLSPWWDVPNIPPGGTTTFFLLQTYHIARAALEQISRSFSLHVAFAYADDVVDGRKQTAQTYALCKKLAPNNVIVTFTVEELTTPPAASPGEWSKGHPCDIWPEPGGIMT